MRVRVQTSGNSLTISPVKDEDFGIVSCTLTSIAGNASAAAMLQVIGIATHLTAAHLHSFMSLISLTRQNHRENNLAARKLK